MDRSVVGEAIFGASDGLLTSLGVVLALQHAPHHLILVTAMCVSLTGALSMGVGTLLEDDRHGPKEALAMGGATAFGTFIPIVPILVFPLGFALLTTAILSLLMVGVIAKVRGGTRKDFLISYGLLGAVAIPTIALALAFGAGG